MELLIIFCCLLTTSAARSAEQIVECCGLKLHDAKDSIAMEAWRQLTSGPSSTYSALVARVCSEERFVVQVWTQLAPTSFQLKWQLTIAPTANQTMHGPAVFSFDSNPLTVTTNDRLAIFMTSSRFQKLPVPYSTLPDGPYSPLLSFSASTFTQPPSLGLVLSLANETVARTFAPYLKFCETPQSCPQLEGGYLNPPVEASYLSYISVPSSCCNKTMSCDADNGLGGQIGAQINLINSLTLTIIQLQQIVNSLLNSTINTGWCPAGFVSGYYGIGYCYKVMLKKLQMAEAAVSCNSFDRSRVVFILTSLEDSFINNLLQNNQTAPEASEGPMKFWTSALFNPNNQNWYWYNYQQLKNEVFGNYRNWQYKMEPVPSVKDEVCATFTRDSSKGDYYWQIANCTQPNYYICKLPKQCL